MKGDILSKRRKKAIKKPKTFHKTYIDKFVMVETIYIYTCTSITHEKGTIACDDNDGTTSQCSLSTTTRTFIGLEESNKIKNKSGEKNLFKPI